MTKLCVRRAVFAALCCCAGSASAQSAAPSFELRGHYLGESMPDGLACRASPAVAEEQVCNDPADTVAGAALRVSYSYLEGQLSSVVLEYRPAGFDRLVEALSAVYGEPSRRQEPYPGMSGRRVRNDVAAWQFGEGSLELRRYGGALTAGFGSISVPAGVARWEQLREAAARAAAAGDSASRALSDPAYFEFQVEKVAVLQSEAIPYPTMLRTARVQGEVLAQYIVDWTGRYRPGSFKVLKSSHSMFTAAVRDGLPGITFRPAEIAGRKVSQLVQQPFVFSLP